LEGVVIVAPTSVSPPLSLGLRPRLLRLGFPDVSLERSFHEQYFRDNIGYVRAAHVLAIGAWAFFGLFMSPERGHGWYLAIFIIAIVVTAVSLGLSFSRAYVRWWQRPIVALVVVSAVLSELHRMVTGHPANWGGVVGLILILAFAYTLLRLQYPYAALAGVLAIVCFNLTRVAFQAPGDIGLVEPDVDLLAFAVFGTASAFALERFARLLFLRERELDRERERGDALLRNILPETIIDRLKTREPGTDEGRIADGSADVTVLFADLVGFTQQAARMEPDELVDTLDEVFAGLDRLADRFGLEKIKTIGDAYMAVAGVPDVRTDHVEAAAEMALETRDHVSRRQWPSGTPMSVRIGIACGPVIAGVIGHRKFAYDVWGDTVNTASRLESAATPGIIQVSHPVYERLRATYDFSGSYVVELKGKGSTTAHTLLGRKSTYGPAVSEAAPPESEMVPTVARG
jgi:class 3 adenylate cyclase